MGKVATSTLPSWESPTHSAGTKIRNGYVAYVWAKWLDHRCRLGSPQRSARGQKSEMATCPTCGQNGYITPAILGSPTLSAGTKIRNGYVAYVWAKWLDHRCCLGSPQRSARGQKSEMATCPTCGQNGYITPAILGSPTHSAGTKIRNGYVAYVWVKWLHHRCCLGSPQRSARGQKSEMATCPTCGQNGYITPAILGSPTLSAGTKIRNGYVAYVWAKWLHHRCCLGSPQRSARGQKSEMATCPTCGQNGYITPAILGSPTLSAGTKIRNGYVACVWAKCLHHPCRLGSPQRSARGQKSEMAMWPTCGQSGYITPAALAVPNAQRGDKNQKWLCGPHVGKVATIPLPS